MKRSLVEGVRSTKRHAAIKLNSSRCVLLLYILAAPLPQSDNVPCLHIARWPSASDHAVNLIHGKMLTSRRRDISHFDLASNQRRDTHRSVLKSRQLRAQNILRLDWLVEATEILSRREGFSSFKAVNLLFSSTSPRKLHIALA